MANKTWQVKLEKLFWHFENDCEVSSMMAVHDLQGDVFRLLEETLEKATACSICGDDLPPLCPDCMAAEKQKEQDYHEIVKERKPL